MVDLSAVEEYRDMMNCSWAEAYVVMGHQWPDYARPPADRGKRLMGYGIIRPHTVEIHWSDPGATRVAHYIRGHWGRLMTWSREARARQQAIPGAVEGEEG